MKFIIVWIKELFFLAKDDFNLCSTEVLELSVCMGGGGGGS